MHSITLITSITKIEKCNTRKSLCIAYIYFVNYLKFYYEIILNFPIKLFCWNHFPRRLLPKFIGIYFFFVRNWSPRGLLQVLTSKLMGQGKIKSQKWKEEAHKAFLTWVTCKKKKLEGSKNLSKVCCNKFSARQSIVIFVIIGKSFYC